MAATAMASQEPALSDTAPLEPLPLKVVGEAVELELVLEPVLLAPLDPALLEVGDTLLGAEEPDLTHITMSIQLKNDGDCTRTHEGLMVGPIDELPDDETVDDDEAVVLMIAPMENGALVPYTSVMLETLVPSMVYPSLRDATSQRRTKARRMTTLTQEVRLGVAG